MRRAVLLFVALAGCGGKAPPPQASAPVAQDDGIPLGALARQALGQGECGLFLWKTGQNARLVLMAKSGPSPFARIVLDGRPIDLPRLAGGDGRGSDDMAQNPNARFGNGRVTASLDLTIESRPGLTDGAIVRGGSIRIDRTDGDGIVVPVSGLLACG